VELDLWGQSGTALLRMFRRAAEGRPVTISSGAEDANAPEFVFAQSFQRWRARLGPGLQPKARLLSPNIVWSEALPGNRLSLL